MEKSKLMFIIIIALLVVLLGATLAFMFIAIGKLGQLSGEAQKVEEESTVSDPSILTPDQIKVISLGDPFSTNLLAGEDGKKRVIRISLEVGLDMTDEKKLLETETVLTEKIGIVRDLCLSVIRNTTYDDIVKLGGEDILKETILAKLQEEFRTNVIVRVYAPDLVTD